MIFFLILVDTSAWYATEVEDDKNHSSATDFLRKLASNTYGSLVTTDYILDETLTLLRMRRGVKVAVQFSQKIRKTKSLQLVWIGEDIFNVALELFNHADERQVWSFTDCTSFALMKELSINNVYAFDSDFESAGFNILPQPI